MNLLPKTTSQFSETAYWDVFFKQRGNKSFEWYGEYPELCGFIHKYIRPQEKFLVAGCGNSQLSANLFDVGYRKIVNVDISKVVVRQMRAQNAKDRPDLEFLEMDLLNMTFEPDSFSAVLDKGTLDALMPENNAESIETAKKYFSEIDRVLKLGGRYICISLLQTHILSTLLDYFVEKGWMIRICRCYDAEQRALNEGATKTLPVFFVVITKFKKMENRKPVLEICVTKEGPMMRMEDPKKIISTILEAQEVAIVFGGLHSSTTDGKEVEINVTVPGEDSVKYRVTVVEKPLVKLSKMSYAAFVVPQGREHEWMFSTPEGRLELLKSTGVDRLVVIALSRNHKYESLQQVQNDMTYLVQEMAPENYKSQINFLTIGGDIGSRKEIAHGHSEISGDYTVEECDLNGTVYRRLYFLVNQNVIQSEARMKKVKSRKGPDKLTVDRCYLSCNHHAFMTLGVTSALEASCGKGQILVVGLGGGSLCIYLRMLFSAANVTAVELDPAVVDVATKYFGLSPDENLTVHVGDGLEFVCEASRKGLLYNAVLFDVDSKDSTVGMSCPPPSFVEPAFLNYVSNLLTDEGLFMLNLVCRDSILRNDVWRRLKEVFGTVCSVKLNEDLNEIMYCWKSEELNPQKLLPEAAQILSRAVQKKKIEKLECIEDSELSDLIMVS